ncbi:MAG: hypothetical protein ACI4SS_06945 [Clostridia bacterium]
MEEIFRKHIELLGEIMLMFKVDEKKAAKALEEEKRLLEEDSHTDNEFLSPAMYNALATIRTSPEQEKPTGQLIAAISDARDELEIIMESVKNL